MDASRFDALARSVTRSASRRGMLALLTGASVAVPAQAAFGADVAARKKKRKKKKKPVTVCLHGQNTTVAKSTAGALLALGATVGTCPPAPPAPPAPFCTGKNACIKSVQCQTSGSQCFCWVRAVGGPSICGKPAVLVDDCDECTGAQVCVLVYGDACPVGSLGCSEPCPNPR
jgi:hypothetical protein